MNQPPLHVRRRSTLTNVVLAIAVTAGCANAEQLDIIAAGDSLTNGYAPRLDFSELGITATVTRLAVGGYSSNQWIAQFLDDPQLRTVDAVFVMLGTNDAWPDGQAVARFEAFKVNMRTIVGRIRAHTVPASERSERIHRPDVIVGVPIPILSHSNADTRLREWYRPWILNEFANSPGVTTLDFYELIQQQPDWRQFYNDGVHLWANNGAGYQWMADQWRDASLAHHAVPEPGWLWLFVPTGWSIADRVRKTRRAYS